MWIYNRIKLAFIILFGNKTAVVVFKGEPTEGDTITVGSMKAEFKKDDRT